MSDFSKPVDFDQARAILANDKICDFFAGLADRYHAEKAHESILDYKRPFEACLPEGVKVWQVQSRPFGFTLHFAANNDLFLMKRKGRKIVMKFVGRPGQPYRK